MNKIYEPKLDADDQEQMTEIKAALEKSAVPTSTPKWEKSPGQIGGEIAGGFFGVTSLFHADLRRQIAKAIEAEREVTEHYTTQMGRWWERLG